MWIVIRRSWAKGEQASAAYVETDYFGPFAGEAEADAYEPECPDGRQMMVARSPLIPGRPRKVAVIAPAP